MSTIDELMLQLTDPDFNPLEWGPKDLDNIIEFIRTSRGEKPRKLTQPDEPKKSTALELGLVPPPVRTVIVRRF